MKKLDYSYVSDLKIYLRPMQGNSVNDYAMDDLVRQVSKDLEELSSDLSNIELMNQTLLSASHFIIHAINLKIHATANVWAKKAHLENSKKFSESLNSFRQAVKRLQE